MLSIGTMLRYGIGQTGAQVFRDTPAFLLPLFMATILGVPPWQAGLAVLIPKIWVMICDPLMGGLSDRLRPRIGRTPFLLAGALASGVGFAALFAITDYSSPVAAVAATALIYLLAVTGFSAFSVPYLAIAAELSTDPHERTKLLVFRIVFTAVGVVLGVGFAQPLIGRFGGGVAGWHAMAVVFGSLCLVTMAATAIGLRKAPLPGAAGTAPGLRGQIAAARGNRPFLVLLSVHFIQSISQACSYTALGLVFLYAVGDVGLMPLFTLTMSVVGLSSQPLWLWLSRRLGKLATFVLASLAFSALTVTWLWIGAFGDATVTLPLLGACRLEVVWLLVRAGLCGILNQGFLLMVMSMFTDTVEYGRETTGADNAGGLAGVWSASEKLAFALGPVLGGVILSATGFVPSRGGAVAQSAEAVHGILLLYSVVPATIFLASLPLLLWYRPGRAKVTAQPAAA